MLLLPLDSDPDERRRERRRRPFDGRTVAGRKRKAYAADLRRRLKRRPDLVDQTLIDKVVELLMDAERPEIAFEPLYKAAVVHAAARIAAERLGIRLGQEARS
jgi:hypothetical protein